MSSFLTIYEENGRGDEEQASGRGAGRGKEGGSGGGRGGHHESRGVSHNIDEHPTEESSDEIRDQNVYPSQIPIRNQYYVTIRAADQLSTTTPKIINYNEENYTYDAKKEWPHYYGAFNAYRRYVPVMGYFARGTRGNSGRGTHGVCVDGRPLAVSRATSSSCCRGTRTVPHLNLH